MKTILLVLAGIAVHGATITSTSNYAAAFGAGGLSNISVYAPRFDPALGTLTSFRMAGAVDIQADLSLEMGYRSGDLDITTSMEVKLKWDGNPVYDLDFIAGTPIHIAGAEAGAFYEIPSAINGSAAVSTSCGFQLSCSALPTDRDYRFSLRLTPYRQANLPSTSYLTGTMNADFTATYEYTPAQVMISNPEPASWALMAIGLGGLAYYRRRRHARGVVIDQPTCGRQIAR